ncbi:MAG: TolC family protein [Lentisphaeria bacterium]|nr:TolC family protein [Lentisphaeria bacterium]
MKKINQLVMALAALAAAAGISGCQSMEDYRNERAEYAIKHFESAKYRELLEGKKLTLRECIDIAKEHNLNLQVSKLEEKVAHEMKTAEMLGMLPELNVNDNFTWRNNEPASSSKKVGEGGLTYGYSKSQDRDVNYLNIDLALSVLDFGLAFFNTQQAQDRVYMQEQRTIRAAQNLTLDVVRAYFSVAAAQKAIRITTGLLEECRNRYELIQKLGKKGQIDPFRAFDETRRFIEMEKRLTNYVRSYENSCVELRSLLGMAPSGKITVEDAYLNRLPDYELPDIETMEQIALFKRPELYEIDIQRHINILEVRKEIVQMFPQVRIFTDFTRSSNSFLYHMNWWELGIRAAYNLLKIPVHVSRAMAMNKQVKAEEKRSFAQAIAVMAQVRIAHANLIATKQRYDIDAKVNKAFAENLAQARRTVRSGDLSQLELDHIRLATAETEIERLMTMGNYYVAYYRMLNAIGINSISAKNITSIRQELEAAKRRAAKELELARREYNARVSAAGAKSDDSDIVNMAQKVVNQPLTNFGSVDFISIYDSSPARATKAGKTGK